jgi:hypothetical protein
LRIHEHTGIPETARRARGDRLFGVGKVHLLDDALRRWLDGRSKDVAALQVSCQQGPLAVTHRTGRRKDSPGTARRYDSVWISRHLTVQRIEHLYDEGITAGSDHAPVVVDLDLTTKIMSD